MDKTNFAGRGITEPKRCGDGDVDQIPGARDRGANQPNHSAGDDLVESGEGVAQHSDGKVDGESDNCAGGGSRSNSAPINTVSACTSHQVSARTVSRVLRASRRSTIF